MKRETIFGAAIGLAALASICAAGRSEGGRSAGARTTRVTIDGASFLPTGRTAWSPKLPGRASGTTGADRYRKLLGRSEAAALGPFSERLAATPSRDLTILAAPPGLALEHRLHLDSESGGVDLATGRCGKGDHVRRRLIAAGWRLLGPDTLNGFARILQSVRGKETMVVCLDEAEGTFLLFRKVDR